MNSFNNSNITLTHFIYTPIIDVILHWVKIKNTGSHIAIDLPGATFSCRHPDTNAMRVATVKSTIVFFDISKINKRMTSLLIDIWDKTI